MIHTIVQSGIKRARAAQWYTIILCVTEVLHNRATVQIVTIGSTLKIFKHKLSCEACLGDAHWYSEELH